MFDIGKKMFDRRKELGLTLEDVGKAVGVGKSTVRKWENGMIKNMGRDKIALIANVLQMSPVEFVPCTEEGAPDPATILKEEEKHLVTAYREAEPPIQRAALKMLEDSAEENRKKKDISSGQTA